MHKELYQRFLYFFAIHIYSEDRIPNRPGTLYKHFVTVYFLGFGVFHTFWKTGSSATSPHAGSFYLKDGYRNDYPVPEIKRRTIQDWFRYIKNRL